MHTHKRYTGTVYKVALKWLLLVNCHTKQYSDSQRVCQPVADHRPGNGSENGRSLSAQSCWSKQWEKKSIIDQLPFVNSCVKRLKSEHPGATPLPHSMHSSCHWRRQSAATCTQWINQSKINRLMNGPKTTICTHGQWSSYLRIILSLKDSMSSRAGTRRQRCRKDCRKKWSVTHVYRPA